jgi:hypothetical protein
MPPGNLVQNLTSNYLQAANAKRSTSLPPDVQVYVEGHEDIAFWRMVLKQYEQTGHVRFRITQPSNTGKISVLDLRDQAGKYLILCVDSDFDYLLDGKTPTSRGILTHSYIFHTHTYSIENYQCYAESLHQVCVQATLNDDVQFDFVAVLEEYSAIVYDLVLWVIYFQSCDKPHHFSLDRCNRIIGFQTIPDVEQQCKQALVEVKKRVATELQRLYTEFSHEVSEMRNLQEKVRTQGFSPITAYLFIQGHTLKTNVVLIILKAVCHRLEAQKFASLQEGVSTEEGERRRKEYKNQKKKVEDALTLNTEFRQCFLYQSIQNDVERYIKEFTTV